MYNNYNNKEGISLKKPLFVLAVVFVLLGCSHKENNTASASKSSGHGVHLTVERLDKDSLSLEDKIHGLMRQKGYPNSEDIIDYEIKGNYIFVLTYNIRKGFDITVLEDRPNDLKWVNTYDTDEETLIGVKKDGPFMMAIRPEDQDVKDVEAFGQPTKLIKVTKNYNGDYKEEIKCWIYVSGNIGKPPQDYNPEKDIKYIK